MNRRKSYCTPIPLDESENDAMMEGWQPEDFLIHKSPDMNNWKDAKPYSTCCGTQVTGHQMDVGLCPSCLEPAEFEWEEDQPEENITGEERDLDDGLPEDYYTREVDHSGNGLKNYY